MLFPAINARQFAIIIVFLMLLAPLIAGQDTNWGVLIAGLIMTLVSVAMIASAPSAFRMATDTGFLGIIAKAGAAGLGLAALIGIIGVALAGSSVSSAVTENTFVAILFAFATLWYIVGRFVPHNKKQMMIGAYSKKEFEQAVERVANSLMDRGIDPAGLHPEDLIDEFINHGVLDPVELPRRLWVSNPNERDLKFTLSKVMDRKRGERRHDHLRYEGYGDDNHDDRTATLTY